MSIAFASERQAVAYANCLLSCKVGDHFELYTFDDYPSNLVEETWTKLKVAAINWNLTSDLIISNRNKFSFPVILLEAIPEYYLPGLANYSILDLRSPSPSNIVGLNREGYFSYFNVENMLVKRVIKTKTTK